MATVRKGNGTAPRRRTRNTSKKDAAASTPVSAEVSEETRAPDRGSNGGGVHIELIRVRAYALFLERGGAHGDDLADWLNAERELLGALKG